jgi:hypothetical protein
MEATKLIGIIRNTGLMSMLDVYIGFLFLLPGVRRLNAQNFFEDNHGSVEIFHHKKLKH